MRNELSQQVGVALDSLSETDREVLVLRYLERLTTKEAAAVQGIVRARVAPKTGSGFAAVGRAGAGLAGELQQRGRR